MVFHGCDHAGGAIDLYGLTRMSARLSRTRGYAPYRDHIPNLTAHGITRRMCGHAGAL